MNKANIGDDSAWNRLLGGRIVEILGTVAAGATDAVALAARQNSYQNKKPPDFGRFFVSYKCYESESSRALRLAA